MRSADLDVTVTTPDRQGQAGRQADRPHQVHRQRARKHLQHLLPGRESRTAPSASSRICCRCSSSPASATSDATPKAHDASSTSRSRATRRSSRRPRTGSRNSRSKNLGYIGAAGQGLLHAHERGAGGTRQTKRLELRAAEESRDALKRELVGEDPVMLPETTAVRRQPGHRVRRADRRSEEAAGRTDAPLYRSASGCGLATQRLIDQLEDQKKQDPRGAAARRLRRIPPSSRPRRIRCFSRSRFRSPRPKPTSPPCARVSARAKDALGAAEGGRRSRAADRSRDGAAEPRLRGAAQELRAAGHAARVGVDGRGCRLDRPHGGLPRSSIRRACRRRRSSRIALRWCRWCWAWHSRPGWRSRWRCRRSCRPSMIPSSCARPPSARCWARISLQSTLPVIRQRAHLEHGICGWIGQPARAVRFWIAWASLAARA